MLNVFTAELKDDKRKLIDDAVAELKNAAGDGNAAAAVAKSPVKKAKKKEAAAANAKPEVKKPVKTNPRRKRRALVHPKKPQSLMIWPLTSVAPFWASKSSKR